MTATITNPLTNDRDSIHLDTAKAIDILSEFAHDCANESESECDAWGLYNYVFPANSFDDVFLLLMNNAGLKESRAKGELHFELKEKEDNDIVDAIVLTAGYLDIQQVIYFQG